VSIIQRFLRHPSGRISLLLLIPIFLLAIFAPMISTYSYDSIHLSLKNLPPSSTFWFGTDDLGRDLFVRIWEGARISLLVGIAAACIDLFIELLWGGIAGFVGGKVDEILMRGADIIYSLPYLLVIIVLNIFFGSGFISLLLAITLTGWMTMARIVRGQILSLKGRDFILAAQAIGASSKRILFVHLLPNAMGPILITLTLTIPSAIFAEAFLSFMGLGIQAPHASWGTMAHEGLSALQYYPWRIFFPAAWMSLTLYAFHQLGEGLKHAFDQYGESFSCPT
jgi:oligopeptide transport system permease protein